MHNFLSSYKITDLIVKTDSVSFCISIFIEMEMEMEKVLIMVNSMTEGTQIGEFLVTWTLRKYNILTS